MFNRSPLFRVSQNYNEQRHTSFRHFILGWKTGRYLSSINSFSLTYLSECSSENAPLSPSIDQCRGICCIWTNDSAHLRLTICCKAVQLKNQISQDGF